MPEPRTFTVMCQDQFNHGTIWIDTVECAVDGSGGYNLDHIKHKAVIACAEAWDQDPYNTDIICMGVILGPVNFLYFDDSHLGD